MNSASSFPLALENFDSLPDSQYVSIDVVKSILGISKSTVYRLVNSGKLNIVKPSPRTSRVSVAELREYIRSLSAVNDSVYDSDNI